MSKICKCSESYVSFGLTKVTQNDGDFAQCLRCSVVMLNASLQPSKKTIAMKRISKKRMMTSMLCLPKENDMTWKATLPRLRFTLEEKPTLQCSYKVGYWIAKWEKLHTIAEELIKPCAEKMVEIMIGSGEKNSSKFRSRMTTFADGLTTWLLMCASKFAPKSNKAHSRPGFNWTRLPIALLKATWSLSPDTRKIERWRKSSCLAIAFFLISIYTIFPPQPPKICWCQWSGFVIFF